MDPTQPMPGAAPTPQQAQTDPTTLQNAMMLQLLNQNAANQQSILGNGPLQGMGAQIGAGMGVNPGTPVQDGTPVGQPGINPAAYGQMFGIPAGAYGPGG